MAVGRCTAKQVHGHEFHYSSLENLDPSGLKFAYEVKRGHGIDGTTMASSTKICSLRMPICAALALITGQPDSLLLRAARHKEQTSRWTRAQRHDRAA